MRILHVDDDEDTRKLVEFVLQGKGWQVVSVEYAVLQSRFQFYFYIVGLRPSLE